MSRINVLVVTTSPDLKAEVMAASVAARADMVLVTGRCVSVQESDALIDDLPSSSRSAVILVGPPAETEGLPHRWLARRADLVVMSVDVAGDMVHIAVRDPRLESLLDALRGLVERVGTAGQARVIRIELPTAQSVEEQTAHTEAAEPVAPHRPLMPACIDWMHTVLREAVAGVPDGNGDVHGLSVTRATLLQALDPADALRPENQTDDPSGTDAALDRALASADPASEPLAAAARAFDLSPLEFRMMLLGLAPELDPRFQRCIGFLLDDIGRRVGTLGLYSSLLGPSPDVRADLTRSGALDRWRVFEGSHQATADEPLRIDPFLARWLLGERDGLARDARVRRVLRVLPWPGAALLQGDEERAKAGRLIGHLLDPAAAAWLLLDGDDPSGWRALLESGALAMDRPPIRVDVHRLAGIEAVDIEDCAVRVGRMARLTGDPLIVDATIAGAATDDDYSLPLFFATLSGTGCHAAAISVDEARLVRLVGRAPFALLHEEALPASARVAAMRAAATEADAYLTEEAATAHAGRYPVRLDALEHAASLARSRPIDYDHEDPRAARFATALKEVAAEGISHLADLIEPAFSLDSVVLPPDRREQLREIVDNVRLAPRVLDAWKFREQLPYGRGVTALFFGPSGTGKTMAAIGIAHRLGVQLLRLDLSKVVSKYIGDTEKNIDRVFADAERSGAAILMDEADALLGKRSEVKDAHDRYANIEVAFLLQRMEAFEGGGPVMLTTNMRQSLDPSFLRRLRFIVEFPRPDVDAREQIWRFCLPPESHALDDAAFRQLARRIDVTGGHIRQITLRAAFIAAAADARIGLTHIAQAARAELAKLGMPAAELDLGAARQAA